jgi:rhodanese-related sulfurtransferase
LEQLAIPLGWRALHETIHHRGKRIMKTLFVPAVLLLFITTTVHAQGQQPPASKRTSLGLYVTAKGAYEKWKADPDKVKSIDVRTPEELQRIGFPKMASKVPLTTSANDFVGRVRRIAQPDDTVLVICRSGNRSAVAVEMLVQAGFRNAYTVVDGFEGNREKDRSSPNYGKRTVNGWKNAKLPWTKG